MFNKNNKNGKILNILLAVIALFIIVFIIAWIVNKSNNISSLDNKSFESNLTTMQDKANSYFTDKLPENIGDSKIIYLSEMYKLNLIDKLTYSKYDCDENASYISIIKTSKTEYSVRSNLVCGPRSDYLVDTIKVNTIVDDEKGNVIVDDEKDDVDLEVEYGTSSDGKTSDDKVNCLGIVCSFEEIPTKCETTYEYEHVKKVAYCPSGYVLASGICAKTNEKVLDATKDYTDETTIIVDAKVNEGKEYKVYTDPIITKTEDKLYCKEGTLGSDGKCHITINATKTEKDTYTCPDGYKSEGTGTNMKCYKPVSASKNYTDWGNPIKVYDTYVKEATYTYELEKKALIGQITIAGKTKYTYAIYQREKYYTCKEGTLNGATCYIYTNPVKDTTTTYSCPSGYTKEGTVCTKETDPTVVKGTTTYSCPSGYTKEGSNENTKCYILKKTDDKYYCEDEKATLVGDKCYITVDGTFNGYTCPDGYTLNGDKCYQTVTDTTSVLYKYTEYIYSASEYVEGYERTGVKKFVTKCTKIAK